MSGAAAETLNQRIGDLKWMTRKFAFGLVRSALPIRTHIGVMNLRANLHGHFTKVPDHIRENLISAFGEEHDLRKIDQIARRYLEYSKRNDLMVRLPNHVGFVESRCWGVEGTHHLDAALENGRGAIVATGHFGFGRMIAPLLQARGYETLILTALDEDGLKRTQKFRRIKGDTHGRMGSIAELVQHKVTVARAALDIRPIIEWLAGNKVVVLAGDGLRSSEFMQFPLMGKQYPFPTGFLKIAAMTGAVVLPGFAKDGGASHACRIEILSALQVDSKSVKESLERFAHVFDHQLHQAPHLWRRWKVKDVFRRVLEWSKCEQRWSQSFSSWCLERDIEERRAT